MSDNSQLIDRRMQFRPRLFHVMPDGELSFCGVIRNKSVSRRRLYRVKESRL